MSQSPGPGPRKYVPGSNPGYQSPIPMAPRATADTPPPTLNPLRRFGGRGSPQSSPCPSPRPKALIGLSSSNIYASGGSTSSLAGLGATSPVPFTYGGLEMSGGGAFQPLKHSPSGVRPSSWMGPSTSQSPLPGPLAMSPTPSAMSAGSFEWGFVPEGGELSTADIIASQSQDYVDERLAEFQATIQQLQYEQERVQKKTFVNWINSYLAKRVPPLRVDDLIEDLKDGTKLLALLEVLSGEKLPTEKGKVLRRPHFLSNANTALQFLQSKRIKLVNINSSDLVDGRPPVVLGLIWTIILYFQIEENTRVLEHLGHRLGGSTSSLDSLCQRGSPVSNHGAPGSQEISERAHARDRSSVPVTGARKALLQWAQNSITKKTGVEVRDFGASWRDGMAFVAIVNCIQPNTLNVDALRQASNRERLEAAFTAAENELGVTRLLDPEDVDVAKPDEKSIMTYVAQFLHQYPEPGTERSRPQVSQTGSFEAEMNNFIAWLNSKQSHVLQLTQKRTVEYMEVKKLQIEFDSKLSTLDRIRQFVHSPMGSSVSDENWQEIETAWQTLEREIRHLIYTQDVNLPGDLGRVAEWIQNAENLIQNDDVPPIFDDEAANRLQMSIEQHKAFFSDLPAIQATFETALQLPVAREVPQQHLEDLNQRLRAIPDLAHKRAARLKFLEHKCCIVAFLALTETKLKGWSVKYGSEDKILQMLEQYRAFVSRNKVFQEFDKAYKEMQIVAEEYKHTIKLDNKETMDVDQFIYSTGDRWKRVSTELRCVQGMLEEVVSFWRKWNGTLPVFEQWLMEACTKLDLPEDDRIEYFQDLGAWKEKYNLLTDSSTFLIATCEPSLAEEVRQKYMHCTQLWEQLFNRVRQYLEGGDLLRHRREYKSILESLVQFVARVDTLLATPQQCEFQAMKHYIEELQSLNGNVDYMEQELKNMSRHFQALVQCVSHDEVDRMNQTLKQQKDNLIRVRAQMAARIQLWNQLAIQQEALERGLLETEAWVQEAEQFLAGISCIGGLEDTQGQLERHQAFFARLVYYQSSLQSKSHIFQSIARIVPSDVTLATEPMLARLAALTGKFSDLCQRVQEWEKKLSSGIQYWQYYQDSLRTMTAWLQRAEALLADRNIDNRQTAELHKEFFLAMDDSLLANLSQSAQDLQNWLPEERRTIIQESFDRARGRWERVKQIAPSHLVKLDFRLQEENWLDCYKELEKELDAEILLFGKQVSCQTLLEKHQECFPNGPVVRAAEESLREMARLSELYSQQVPNDTGLSQSLGVIGTQWEVLLKRAKAFESQLLTIPQQWHEYEQKFAEMISWMGSVDASIAKITSGADSAENFDKIRDDFQDICKDVDSRREDMKWLVQTLDALITHRPEDEIAREQSRLEALIARYKSLVPSIELTMVRADVLTKCYTCREETRRVCTVLEEVYKSSSHDSYPDSLGTLEALIEQQQLVFQQLEDQRTSILALIQRGKDLQRHQSAPEFMAEEVQALENAWNMAQKAANEKLKHLKNSQKLWTDYQDQKDEIMALLEQAEAELQRVYSRVDPLEVAAELRARHEASVKLREATQDMLKRLRELLEGLTQVTGPDHSKDLVEEVRCIERRIEAIQNLHLEKITSLELFSDKLKTLLAEVDSVRSWLQQAQKLLQQLLTMSLSPDERVLRTKELQAQILQKMTILERLEKEALLMVNQEASSSSQDVVDTTPVTASTASVLGFDVGALRSAIASMQETVDEQSTAVEQDYHRWIVYTGEVEKVKPWIDDAEGKLISGLPKPSTLQDAQNLLQTAQAFEAECQQQLLRLQTMSTQCQEMKNPGQANDEVEALHARWAGIHDSVASQLQRLQFLQTAWEGVINKMDTIVDWLDGVEKEQEQLSRISTTLSTLEKQLADLKGLTKAASGKQSELVTVTQECDLVAVQLSHEGATHLRSQVTDLKSRIAKLSENARSQVNVVSETIVERQDLQAREADVHRQLDRNALIATQLDEVMFERVEAALESVHQLLQSMDAQSPARTAVETEITELKQASLPEELNTLTERESLLRQKTENLQQILQAKKTCLERWQDLAAWHQTTTEQLRHAVHQLQTLKLNPQELAHIMNEAEDVQLQCEAHLMANSDLAQLNKKSKTTVKAVGCDGPCTVDFVIHSLEDHLQKVRSMVSERTNEIRALDDKWGEFSQVRDVVTTWLNNTRAQADALSAQGNDLKALEQLESTVGAMLEDGAVQQAKREKLHALGKQLIQANNNCVGSVQNTLAVADTDWDNLQRQLITLHAKYGALIRSWKEREEALQPLYVLTSDCEDQLAVLKTTMPNELEDAVQLGEKYHKILDSLRKARPAIESVASQSKHLVQDLKTVPNFDTSNIEEQTKDLKESWKSLVDATTAATQGLDTQVVIWKQFAQLKDTLLNWASDMKEGIAEATAQNLEPDVIKAKIDKYKHELPSYESMQANVEAKATQLSGLNNGRNINSLQAATGLIGTELGQVSQLVREVEQSLDKLGQEEQLIRETIRASADILSKIRENLTKCEDFIGSDDALVERYQYCDKIQVDLAALSPQLAEIQQQVQQLQSAFLSSEAPALAKEAGNLQRRWENLQSESKSTATRLRSLLEKRYTEKLANWQRFIATSRERLRFYELEAGADRFSAETKLSGLQDLESMLNDGNEKLRDLESTAKALEQIKPEAGPDMNTQVQSARQELQVLLEDCNDNKASLGNIVDILRKHELITENFSSWLRETEGRIRAESAKSFALAEVTQKLDELKGFLTDIEQHNGEYQEIVQVTEQIVAMIPESYVPNYVSHLNMRYSSAQKWTASQLEQLKKLQTSHAAYVTAVERMRTWLRDSETQLQVHAKDVAAPGSKPNLAYQSKLQALKTFIDQKDAGQILLNEAVDAGDSLISALTPEEKTTIRKELKTLRDDWETHLEQVNALYKKVDGILLQLSSFDDSCRQICSWIDETRAKLEPADEFKSSLPDKKVALQTYRVVHQDIVSHQSLVNRLKERLQDISDPEAGSRVDSIVASYQELFDNSQRRVVRAEQDVAEHEAYSHAVEKFREWLSSLESDLVLIAEDVTDKEAAQAKLMTIDTALQQKEQGQTLLSECQNCLDVMLKSTDSQGRSIYQEELELQKQSLQQFVSTCEGAKEKLQSLCSRWAAFEDTVQELGNWLRQKESCVQDQALKGTLAAKEAHLERLVACDAEIAQKSQAFTTALEQSQSWEGESPLQAQIPQLVARYHALKTSAKDMISRYRQYVKEHQEFNAGYKEFMEKMATLDQELAASNEVVGDYKVLLERRSNLESLGKSRNAVSQQVDALADLGEKLYVHTAPDGREGIRQQLRTLRDTWDTFSDNLTAAVQKLDSCLQQFAEFTGSQEQLTRWLRDIEQAMQQHADLKSSLQEKRAQLQNHKLVHQEILTHQPLVESVCDRAQQLVDQTQDKSLNSYISSIKQLFHNITDKSKKLAEQLETCIKDHTQLNQLTKEIQDWFASQRDQLETVSTVKGEKNDLNRSLCVIKELKGRKDKGDGLLQQLQQLCDHVCLSTSQNGCEVLKKTVSDLEAGWKRYNESLDETEKNVNNVLEQWSLFERNLDQLNHWFREQETVLREQLLQTTLDEKEAQLKAFVERREIVTGYESTVESFIDLANALLLLSGVERIKPLISQASNKYQLLHVQSKETISKWQGIVSDHRAYEDKFMDTLGWLFGLEAVLERLVKSDDTQDITEQSNRIAHLMAEREQATHKLGSLTSLGERLFPDTTANGREKIRHDLKTLRARWDDLEKRLSEQQKWHEQQQQLKTSYQEGVTLMLGWLEAMERSVGSDHTNWLSLAEIRSRMLKHKTSLQDALSHKRVVEALKERAQSLAPGTDGQQVAETIACITQRYEALCGNLQSIISNLEWLLQHLQQHHDLVKAHQDWQQQKWDALNVYTDYGGNKHALKSRRAKLDELITNKSEGDANLVGLTNHVAKVQDRMPARAKEALEHEIANLKFDFDKYCVTLADVRHGIEERLSQWIEYESTFDRLLNWLNETETALKDYTPRATLEQKQEQLEKYQVGPPH